MDVPIVEVCVEYFNNFYNVCIISYQNVSAGIGSHIYTAIESTGNDKVCILHLTLYIFMHYADCTCAKNSCDLSRRR